MACAILWQGCRWLASLHLSLPPSFCRGEAATGLYISPDLILPLGGAQVVTLGAEGGVWPVVLQLMASTTPPAQGLREGWNLPSLLLRLPLGEEGLFLYLDSGPCLPSSWWLHLPRGPGLSDLTEALTV